MAPFVQWVQQYHRDFCANKTFFGPHELRRIKVFTKFVLGVWMIYVVLQLRNQRYPGYEPPMGHDPRFKYLKKN